MYDDNFGFQFQFPTTLSRKVHEIKLVVLVRFFLIMISASARKFLRTRKPNTPNAEILEPVSSTSRRGARAAYHDEYP